MIRLLLLIVGCFFEPRKDTYIWRDKWGWHMTTVPSDHYSRNGG